MSPAGEQKVANDSTALIDWGIFSQVRTELGASFIRILGYFREDGGKAIAAIEDAIRNRNAAALVIPAHTLKGESLQFGAEPLAALAEHIEKVARRCVEIRQEPDELIADVVRLRPMFDETIAQIDREASPLMERRASGGFGRKAPTSFGRA
jgi:HPt (histidine-containing phosphotransfer) domain-containing protein